MPRTNKILIRSGTVAPTASDFAVGEPAFDKSAGKLYIKNAAGTMVELGTGGGASSKLVRSDFVSGFMYIGTAASGSSESSAVWTIKKTLVTSAGTISTRTTATSVAWTDRLSATYA